MNNTIRLAKVVLLVLLCNAAIAETKICTEVTPPAVISQSGVYCLKRDHTLTSATGAAAYESLGTGYPSALVPAIAIRTGDVVLDFNGFRVLSTSAELNTGVAVIAGSNVTIRNGTLRGFVSGVVLKEVGRVRVVEDMLIETSSSKFRPEGVNIDGSDTLIRRNRFSGPGGFAVHCPPSPYAHRVFVTENEVFGQSIRLTGRASMVIGNRITDSSASGTTERVAIVVKDAFSETGVVRNNVIVANPMVEEEITIPESSVAERITHGIAIISNGVRVVDNIVLVNGRPYNSSPNATNN